MSMAHGLSMLILVDPRRKRIQEKTCGCRRKRKTQLLSSGRRHYVNMKFGVVHVSIKADLSNRDYGLLHLLCTLKQYDRDIVHPFL